MECATTTSFSMAINGGSFGFFRGARGLWQGDPLLPYLFGICIEIFGRQLQQYTSQSGFGFHPQCAHMWLSYLTYADDLLLSRGDATSVGALISCLEDFGATAGLQVNHLKSNIYVVGVDDTMRQHLISIIGFPEATMPFQYLGIPLAAERLQIFDYSPLLDSLSHRIHAWPQKTLSYAGKVQLITSVLQGVECFWLSMLPLPLGIIDRIYNICRSFMWTSRHPPISWANMCKPKEEGGLGFRDLRICLPF